MSNQSSSDLPSPSSSCRSSCNSNNNSIVSSCSSQPGSGKGMIEVALPNSAVRSLVRESNGVESRTDTRSTNSHLPPPRPRHASASCSASTIAPPEASSSGGGAPSKCQNESQSHVDQVESGAKAESGIVSKEKATKEVKTSEDTVISHQDTDNCQEMCKAESSSSKAADGSKGSSSDKGNDDSDNDDNNKKEGSEKMYEIPLTILPKKVPSKSPGNISGKKQPSSSKRGGNTSSSDGGNGGGASGRWNQQEHQAFLDGLKVYGREWKKVAEKIPTRTSAQIRSHAQKYFSKLAREEAMAMHEPTAAAPTAAVVSGGTTGQDGQQDSLLSQSVQRTAERILEDPTGAQQEVEDTLRQLRERYRQLQIRLEESQGRTMPPLDRIVEEGAAPAHNNGGGGGVPAGFVPRGGHDHPGMDRRKRSLEDAFATTGAVLSPPHYQAASHDDGSSVASDLSASLASLSNSREFGDEELIALHVLGGTLPRSASGTELHQQVAAAGAAAAQSSSSSSLSEGSGDDEADSSSTEAKRQRLAQDSNRSAASHEGDDHRNDDKEAML